ncbi:hypothetical protein [Streptomyces sp. NPDC002619]|uniref:hypothetical protein n=1 Tax=Streptomyces sp. NPDC002619 TaxID=3364655 RepID=UPI0036CA31F0
MKSPFQYYHTTYGTVEGVSPERGRATASSTCSRFDGVLTLLHRPEHLDHPRREPDPDNQHFGFASGIRLCYGAPFARIGTQAALGAPIPHLGAACPARDPCPLPTERHAARPPRDLSVRR